MITASPEPFSPFLPEINQMIQGHYRELALHHDVIKLEPRYDQYAAREQDGSLMLIVAREGGRAIGYFIGFLAWHMHYASSLTLLCDIFYVLPEDRKGFAGMRLFQAMETEAKRRGVQRIIVATKLHSDAGPLLKFLKYTPIETNYSKLLGA